LQNGFYLWVVVMSGRVSGLPMCAASGPRGREGPAAMVLWQLMANSL
jgi:hypothetical protein